MDFSEESQLKVAFNKVYLSVDVWMQRRVLYSNQTTTPYSQHAADFESFPKGIVGKVAQKI